MQIFHEKIFSPRTVHFLLNIKVIKNMNTGTKLLFQMVEHLTLEINIFNQENV